MGQSVSWQFNLQVSVPVDHQGPIEIPVGVSVSIGQPVLVAINGKPVNQPILEMPQPVRLPEPPVRPMRPLLVEQTPLKYHNWKEQGF